MVVGKMKLSVINFTQLYMMSSESHFMDYRNKCKNFDIFYSCLFYYKYLKYCLHLILNACDIYEA